MFIDERELTVRSGAGGDGNVAWRREARIPRGGPAGGDGGRGGSVIFVADPQLTTFGDMEDIRVVKATPGDRGGGNNRTGASGPDRLLPVPVGTTVYDTKTGERLEDLSESGTRWVAARGGQGGLGNTRFATATRQRPMNATDGEPSEERRLKLELRLLADVGLVGLPNAGKSTLLSRLSSARPRIAGYPFTTLQPHLGIVELPRFRRFVMADLPGLIEGAHQGLGLGDRFLRHVERTRVLLHLVDLAPLDGGDPAEAYRQVRAELKAHGRGLDERPEIVAATKIDAVPPQDREATLSQLSRAVDRRVHPISAVSGEGLEALLSAVATALEAAPAAPEVPRRRSPNGDEGDRGDEGAPS